MAPQYSFGDVEYWNNRFQKEDEFEWLLPFEVLEPIVRVTIQSHLERPQLFHIGCGSSNLSTKLSSLVQDPRQIHNVDYSSIAVEKGQKREQEAFSQFSSAHDIKSEQILQTRWSTLNLLSVDEVLSFSLQRDNNRRYDIILDKSTSDAIACAPDINVSLPYHIRSLDALVPSTSERTQVSLHPLYALATHLAFLAAPGCHWLVLSYSNARFTFWDTRAEMESGIHLTGHLLKAGFTHPGQLWRLVKREEILKPMQASEAASPVHRPPETIHLYVLERTELALNTH